MKKKTLNLEDITVESFSTSTAVVRTGTVRAHAAEVALTPSWPPPCTFEVTCWSCIEPSCFEPCTQGEPTCAITCTAPSIATIIQPPGQCCDCR